MTHYACLFEAKSIQEYILRSGRLRHIVGASELIDSLTGCLLDEVLTALRLSDQDDGQVRFSRRAGGAIYLFSNDKNARDDFRNLWTLTVRQYAPGLTFVIANGEGKNDYAAYQLAKEQLQAVRNRQAVALPAGSPVTYYAPRTGLPAVTHHKKLGFQDEATARFGQDEFWLRGGLTKRFAASMCNDWPRDLEYIDEIDDNETEGKKTYSVEFPFLSDNRYLGLLHADGNGLGQLLMNLGDYVKNKPKQFIPVFRDFSTAIQKATEAAAKAATLEVLEPARKVLEAASDGAFGAYPARPIVLGGDDLTMLIRADLALPFAQEFLEQFEKASGEQMARLRGRYPELKEVLPAALTAGAGIAFVKSNHPFYMTHHLTEGLAGFAKNRAKAVAAAQSSIENRIPPTLAFYRVTTASHGSYDEVREDELTFRGDSDALDDKGQLIDPKKVYSIVTSLGTYGIGSSPELPALADVLALRDLFAQESVARGPARQLLTLIGQDIDDARRRYARWREVMKQRAPKTLAEIDDLLVKLCGTLDQELPISKLAVDDKGKPKPQVTPLADLATLLTLGKTPNTDQPSSGDAA